MNSIVNMAVLKSMDFSIIEAEMKETRMIYEELSPSEKVEFLAAFRNGIKKALCELQLEPR